MLGKSITNFIKYVQEVFLRFPIAMFFCLISVASWIILIAGEYEIDNFFPTIISSSLGLVASLALHLYFEHRKISGWVQGVGWGILILLLVIYYFRLGKVFDGSEVSYCVLFRLLGLMTLATLAVSLGPFWSQKDNERYLLFNRHLFSHYLVSAAYTAVLLIGLVLAFLALDRLFGVNVDEKIYGYLTVILIGIFFTVVFLASIPKKEEPITTEASPILKVFARYILVPIVAVYALIIFAYAIKNIFSPGLAQEWTQELIWWFYVAGYFTFLINLAVDLPDTLTRFGPFGKGFLYAIIPISILVMISIGISMYQDGITELKYIVASMSLYLLLISLYLLIRPNKDFRWISGLLMIFTLIASIGIMSACQVSIRNQKKHLISSIQKNNIVNSNGLAESVTVSAAEKRMMLERIRFLKNRLSPDSIMVNEQKIGFQELEKLYYNRSNDNSFNVFFPFASIPEQPVDQYSYFIPFVEYQDPPSGRYLKLKQGTDLLQLYDQKSEIASIALTPYLEELQRQGDPYPERKITLNFVNQQIDFFISEVSFRYQNDQISIDYLRGVSFLIRE